MRSSVLSLRLSYLALGALCLSCPQLFALDLQLRPNGSPTQLNEALQQIRDARKNGDLAPATIVLASGDYFIESAITLEPQDSNLSIVAESGAHPRILGGKQIAQIQVGPNGTWTAKLDPKWRFEALWVNEKRATRAQTPNIGFLEATGVGSLPIEGIPLPGPAAKHLLTIQPEDVRAIAELPPEFQKDVQVSVYHHWDVSRLRVAGALSSDGTLQFTGAGRAFFEHQEFHRLKLENYPTALDAPGEWFLSRDGTLSYIPFPGETPENSKLIAPIADQLIVIRGEPTASRFVENVSFKGIAFTHQNWTCPEKGIHAGQAEAGLASPAIGGNGAHNITFEDCEIAHTITHAVWMREGCNQVRFTHCYFHDLGAGGVYAGDPGVSSDGPKHTHHITVDNCIFRGGGRFFPAGIGITFFHVSDSTIRHCDISDFYYSAVSLGWTWGYKSTVAGRNTLEYCHLHHLGWGVLSDMGGVYTLGSQLGTVIRNNHIHDIGCASYGAWGMYNDEGSTGVLWENNLVTNTQTAGFHQHYGRGNLVRNNILAWGKEEDIRWSKPEDTFALAFEKNIVLMGDGRFLAHVDKNWLTGRVFLADNIYWKHQDFVPNFAGKTWDEWQALGNDVRSLLADPLFKDPQNGDWTLQSNSPALKLGFVPFDWREAGVTGTAEWKGLAGEPLPPMVYGVKPKAVSLQLNETFESEVAGQPPSVTRKSSHKPAIVVVENFPGAKGKCIELRDGPESQPAYHPHFSYSPHHTSGATRIAFDFRFEPEYELIHEWRDASSPYQIGPVFSVRNSVIKVGDKTVTSLQPLTWIHLEIEAVIGENVGGDFSITVTPEGGTPQRFDGLRAPKGALKELAWAGFISPGTVQAKAWIDNIRISNH